MQSNKAALMMSLCQKEDRSTPDVCREGVRPAVDALRGHVGDSASESVALQGQAHFQQLGKVALIFKV